MRGHVCLATALALVATAAAAQVIGGPPHQNPNPYPRDNPTGIGTSIGISFDFSKGKGKPKAEVLEMRDADIPYRLEDQFIFVMAGTSADATRIAGQARVTVIEYTAIEALGKAMVVAGLAPGDSVDAAMARAQSIKGVAWAQPNFQFQPLGSIPKRISMMGITSAAQMRVSGTIAMIDTPVELTNPALKGATVTQAVFGKSTIPALHGTAIASLLVGGGEVNGMAQGARLISLAAFDPNTKGSGVSQTSKVAKAMDAAWRLRPDVLNLSFGGREDRLLGELLGKIDARGICIAAAAGNGGANSPVLFPARHPAVLAVTAADEKLRGYSFAARGPEIDVTGVGVGLLANVPGGYRQVSGTSFATAIISGALMRMPQCSERHDPAGMRQQVASFAQDMGAPGPDPVFGAGLFRLSRSGKK
jgi:hypothetical protein